MSPSYSGAPPSSDWLLPVILVNFSDSTLVHTAAQVQSALFDTTGANPTGSIVDYYNWLSGGSIRVRGEVVATVTLPQPEYIYSYDAYGLDGLVTPSNDAGLVHDAVVAADTLVDWRRYDRTGDGFVDMVWVVHPGQGAETSGKPRNFWSITSALTAGWNNSFAMETHSTVPGSTIRIKVDRFTVLPELSGFHPGAISEIGVYCHEFGHALQLPDLYDTSALGGTNNVGPGAWSLMSTGAWGGDGASPQYPTHMGGWCSVQLGLTTKFRPLQDSLVTLAPLSSGGQVCEFWFQGESNPEHYLLEARHPEGFDRNLPNGGLLVTQVDDAAITIGLPGNRINAGLTPGMRVVEADGDFDMMHGWNRGDANDPCPGALGVTHLDDGSTPALRTFAGAPTNLSFEQVTRLGTSTRVLLHVRALGWSAIHDMSEASFTPASSASRGRHAVVTPQGTEYEVFSDARAGVAQVLLRSRTLLGDWSSGTPVTTSASGAYNPVICLLPSNGLAVVWVDIRTGTPQVFYRARIGGTWGAETQLSTAGGNAPAVVADRLGRVLTAWLESGSPYSKLRFLAFPASSPGGTPMLACSSNAAPSAPSLATSADGRGWLVWPDYRTGVPMAYFARYSPDSGLRPELPVQGNASAAQPSCDVAVDSTGAVCFAWQQTALGSSEIHFQKRTAAGTYSPVDTVLIASSDALQNPSIATDVQLGVHLAFEHSTGIGQKVQYKRWRQGIGWDGTTTDVSDPAQGSATRLAMLAVTNGNATVLYWDNDGTQLHARDRRRRLDGNVAVDVPATRVAAAPGITLAPNPARAGGELLVFARALAAATPVDLYDAGGRRVASSRVSGGVARFAPATTRSLGPGIYFARAAGADVGRVVVLR